ncbi:aminoacyl-tRNA deacylase [Berryella wangjianweii]|uniref:Cys-tRNA(Pro)/Cys-tRNA(Cys) deacylase n=1 Tax=Berryella wangjianweii TaxID=2734634 RepID=A0A6M8J6W6_9ACTN|nr:aminoacyl-tRNA deacylase [Berryella wangjianweii]QKF07139.1 aminoacyl-tRNA deacylase [Berryella wangjianweii]
MSRSGDKKTNAQREAEASGHPVKALTYDPRAALGGTEVAALLGEDPDAVFKTLVTQGRTGGHLVFIVPVSGELDLKRAAQAAGEKAVAMIHQRELLPLTGYVHGGCSPLGMRRPFPTFIDETALLYDQVFFSGGRRGLQLRMSPEHLAQLADARFCDLLCRR